MTTDDIGLVVLILAIGLVMFLGWQQKRSQR